jgi:hypothetical protein
MICCCVVMLLVSFVIIIELVICVVTFLNTEIHLRLVFALGLVSIFVF